MAFFIPLILRKFLKIQLIAIGAVAVLLWQAYERYGPEMPEVSVLRKAIADTVIGEITDSLNTVTSVRRVFVFKFADDNSEYFTDQLRQKIELDGHFELIPKSWVEKIKDDLNLPENAVSTLADALDLGKEIGAEGVIFGRILEFSQSSGGGVMQISLRFADVSSGSTVLFRMFEKDLSASEVSFKNYQKTIKDRSLLVRIFYWVLFTALLSIIAVPLIKMVVKEQSNAANFVLVIVLSSISLMFAGAMTGFQMRGVFEPLFMLGALIGSIVYFLWFSNMIAGLSRDF